MSRREPGWLEEEYQDLARARGTRPRSGPFGLLLVAGVLLLGLTRLRTTAEDYLLELSQGTSEDDTERWGRELQAALDEKAAGRYRDCWRKLRALHDRSPADPAVNLELATYHHEVGNHDFADGYLRLVEEVQPDRGRVRLLRARLLLLRAAEAHRRAGLAETDRLRALALLGEAAADLEEARARLPEVPSEEAPRPALESLGRELARQQALVDLKRAERRVQGGSPEDRQRARALLDGLLARTDLDEDVRVRARQGRESVKEQPLIWRSGP